MSTASDDLLRYRPWRGTARPPIAGAWAMGRLGFVQLTRRKQFWVLYALALMIFFFFFYGQYLTVWIQQQTAQQTIPFAGVPIKLAELTQFLDFLNLNGSAHTFANFIWFQGYIAMIVLAFAGAVLIGNDFQYHSLPYYLSKPIRRWHYILGKCISAGLIVNMVTTIPALILYIQAGLIYDWEVYYIQHARELIGIFGYGLVLTITLSLLLAASAVLTRRTVPLVMLWSGLFVLCRMLANMLVDGARLDAAWRLIDLWNNMYIVGLAALGSEPNTDRVGSQPTTLEALAAIVFVNLLCLAYLRRRVQAVDVVA